jgi:hypothetical protein
MALEQHIEMLEMIVLTFSMQREKRFERTTGECHVFTI